MTATTITAPDSGPTFHPYRPHQPSPVAHRRRRRASSASVATAGDRGRRPRRRRARSTVGGKAIPLLGFAQLTFVAAIIGTILAVVLSRRASRPRRTFVVTTVALTLRRRSSPTCSPTRTTATRLALALTHVVAAAIVIPALASRLSD